MSVRSINGFKPELPHLVRTTIESIVFDLTFAQGLTCNFKVVETVKISGTCKKYNGPLSVFFSVSQAVILIKFRFTGCVAMDKTVFPASERRSQSHAFPPTLTRDA